MVGKKPSADYCPKSQAGANHGPTDKHERCVWCGYRYWTYTELDEYRGRMLRTEFLYGLDCTYAELWDPDFDGGVSNFGTKRHYRTGD